MIDRLASKLMSVKFPSSLSLPINFVRATTTSDLVNESSSKSAGRGVESSRAKHGVAAAVSNAVRRIVTDPGKTDILTKSIQCS